MREVYALLGQSNQAGHQDTLVPQTYTNIANIFKMDSSNNIVPAVGDPLVPAYQVGPGLAFADRLLTLRADPSLQICLIPVIAVQSILDWGAGIWYAASYGVALQRMLLAKQWGDLKGISWYAGEYDTSFSTSLPTFWLPTLCAIIRGLRADVNIPDLPAIVTRLGPDPGPLYPFWAAIHLYIDRIGVYGATNTAVVTASDLAVGSDGVHLTAASEVTLGHRYADAFFAMG